jgi:hypothetical protein
MTPGERSDDDEMDLINAEFESMVSGLNLDQSSPRTYLDELEEIDREEADEFYRANQAASGRKNPFPGIIQAIIRWWNRKDNNEGDGATV